MHQVGRACGRRWHAYTQQWAFFVFWYFSCTIIALQEARDEWKVKRLARQAASKDEAAQDDSDPELAQDSSKDPDSAGPTELRRVRNMPSLRAEQNRVLPPW